MHYYSKKGSAYSITTEKDTSIKKEDIDKVKQIRYAN